MSRSVTACESSCVTVHEISNTITLTQRESLFMPLAIRLKFYAGLLYVFWNVPGEGTSPP